MSRRTEHLVLYWEAWKNPLTQNKNFLSIYIFLKFNLLKFKNQQEVTSQSTILFIIVLRRVRSIRCKFTWIVTR